MSRIPLPLKAKLCLCFLRLVRWWGGILGGFVCELEIFLNWDSISNFEPDNWEGKHQTSCQKAPLETQTS
jgi:hypothetical protein